MRLGGLQQIVERLELVTVVRALRNAEVQGRKRNHFTLAVQNVDLAAQLGWRVEQDRSGVDVTRVDVAVHREAGGTPLVRDRVRTTGVEGHVHPLVFDVAEVGQFAGIKGIQHAFANHDLDHVVAGNSHVVRPHLAGLEGRQHGFVTVVGVHGDFDAGFGFEFGQQFIGDVLEPVVDRQLAVRHCLPGKERQGSCTRY